MTSKWRRDLSRDVEAVRDWWREMQPDGRRRGDRAGLARLRRAASAVDALSEPSTIELCRKLGVSAASRFPSAGRVAALAGVLSHVRAEVAASPAGRRPTMMGLVGPQGTSDEALSGAKLKEIRFRALLTTREDDELLTSMRRLVRLAGDFANIRDLAGAILDWSDDTRRRWAFDYYGGAPAAAPTADAPTSPDQTESAP